MDLSQQNRTYHEPQEAMAYLPNYFAWTYGGLSEHVSGVVVELGCGAGLGIPHYADRADVIYAVDHDPEVLRRVQVLEHATEVRILAADLISDWSELADVQADTIIMMDVLEHFNDDTGFLCKAANVLGVGGKLLVKVPAQSRLYSSVDEASGHYRRYDKHDLEHLAASAKLTIRSLRYINPFGAIAYRLKRNKSSSFSRTFSPTQLKLINLAIPVIKLGDLVPVLPGLSLIGVMERLA